MRHLLVVRAADRRRRRDLTGDERGVRRRQRKDTTGDVVGLLRSKLN